MTTRSDDKTMDAAPAEGRITDEAIAAARRMIGMQLRPEGPYLQDASPDTLRNFCNGIGDLNPLYRDTEYGRTSRYATMLGHPMFPMAYGWLGRTRWGLPGVHGFYAGNDWEMFRNIRPGDRITAIERVVGVEEKQSRFSGRLVIQYVQAEFANQRDDLVARVPAGARATSARPRATPASTRTSGSTSTPRKNSRRSTKPCSTMTGTYAGATCATGKT